MYSENLEGKAYRKQANKGSKTEEIWEVHTSLTYIILFKYRLVSLKGLVV